MTVRFKPIEPEPATRWFYTPGTKVVFIKQFSEPTPVNLRFV